MVSVTMTTVAKEAGPRRPSTLRNEGWREAHPSSGCSFLEFSCQAVKYGPPLGSKHLEAIFGKKNASFKTALIVFALLSLSFLVVTQIRGNISRSSPPLPTTVRALHLYREKISASLVHSRRIVLIRARRSQQLVLLFFGQIISESHHGGIRTHGPTLLMVY